MSTDLDLVAVYDRAEDAYRHIRDLYISSDGLQPVIREHFNHDVPALIGAVQRLTAELVSATTELDRLRAGKAVTR